jgi:hypothetical protein
MQLPQITTRYEIPLNRTAEHIITIPGHIPLPRFVFGDRVTYDGEVAVVMGMAYSDKTVADALGCGIGWAYELKTGSGVNADQSSIVPDESLRLFSTGRRPRRGYKRFALHPSLPLPEFAIGQSVLVKNGPTTGEVRGLVFIDIEVAMSGAGGGLGWVYEVKFTKRGCINQIAMSGCSLVAITEEKLALTA